MPRKDQGVVSVNGDFYTKLAKAADDRGWSMTRLITEACSRPVDAGLVERVRDNMDAAMERSTDARWRR
jgi:hypothetical protein